jgi:hypothetical protein
VKPAVVVQRYGQAINDGAELHSRHIAEHPAGHTEVEVLTTCATDYIMWRNELVAGVERINGLPVRRFPVREERDPHLFGRRSDRVFQQRHSLDDELNWLDAEGLTSPALIDHMFERLSKEPAPRPTERLPGWFAGQREDLPPADEVLAALPAGAALAGASDPPPRLAVSQPPGGA